METNSAKKLTIKLKFKLTENCFLSLFQYKCWYDFRDLRFWFVNLLLELDLLFPLFTDILK